MGQTWNEDLRPAVGTVIGDEGLYARSDYLGGDSDFNPDDQRGPPGRPSKPGSAVGLNEGFGEDPRLASDMIDEISRGISGIDEPSNAKA